MVIELTEAEYHQLIDMLFSANWLLNAGYKSIPPELQLYEMLEQKIIAMHPQSLQSRVTFDAEQKRYNYTADFYQDFIPQMIEPAENAIFWEQLITMLAERDFIAEHGEMAFKIMDRDQLTEDLAVREQHYQAEFIRDGIKRLVLMPHKVLN